MHLRTPLLIAVSMAVTTFVCAAPELKKLDNILENSSLELDNDRDGQPDGWGAFAFDSPAELAWDSSGGRTGTRCVSIRDSFNPEDSRDWKRCTGRWVSPPRPVKPGSAYTLVAWAKTRDLSGDAYAHIAWHRDSKWLSEDGTPRMSGTGDWRRLTVTARAPTNAAHMVVSLNLSRGKGTAWFDDVQLTGISDEVPKIDYTFNDTSTWFPFNFRHDDTNLDTIDLTHLLHKPAGKQGFVTARNDGHFYFDNGKRARFIGTNLGARHCAPDKSRAPAIAARLAKYGVNMLRLHAMDGTWGGLIDYGKGTSQEFNPDYLNRLDFFIAELKKHGIYIYMDLLDYRMFKNADGVRHGDDFTHNWQGSMKGASVFDARMIELQKDYATKLLTHRNPYTGLRYVDDPAMAVVEVTNENSVFYFFQMSGLSHQYYRDELQRLWNRWLLERYGDREALARAWTDAALQKDEDAARGSVALPFGRFGGLRPDPNGNTHTDDPLLQPARISDMYRFFVSIQRHYYQTMVTHLRKLGVRVPIAGTNQQFAVADCRIDALMGTFMSRNQYWRHPHVHAKPFFKFNNEPMLHVDIPTQRTPLAVVANTSVAGKPQAVAEFNFPWPNEYRCEGWLMSAAYACLQDWDIFLFFSHGTEADRLEMFRSHTDPARWGAFPAAALMFHRHDVSAARNEIHVINTLEDTYTPRPHTTRAKHTAFRFLTFTSKARNCFIEDRYTGNADVALACGLSADVQVEGDAKAMRFKERPWETWLYPRFVERARALALPGYGDMAPDTKRFVSDTGQLDLDYGSGFLTIKTPKTQGAIGHLAQAGTLDLGGVQMSPTTDFAAVTVTSLDDLPIGQSRRLLITALARAENTSQGFVPPPPEKRHWGPMQWSLPSRGRPPVLAEPVQATVRIPVPAAANVYALDETGKRRGKLACNNTPGTVTLNPAVAKSIWCEIVVE